MTKPMVERFITLREEIFVGINFREFLFLDISQALIFANLASLKILRN